MAWHGMGPIIVVQTSGGMYSMHIRLKLVAFLADAGRGSATSTPSQTPFTCMAVKPNGFKY